MQRGWLRRRIVGSHAGAHGQVAQEGAVAVKREDPTTKGTIDDKTWQSLQERARKANPELDSFSNPKAVAHRLAANRQHKNRRWN